MPTVIATHPARPDEARALLALTEAVNAASPYTLHAAGERPSWHGGANPAEDLAAFLGTGLNALLVAEIGGRPAGTLTATGGRFQRNCGVATVALGVLPQQQGRGAGTRLLAEAEAWARGRGLHRLELTVAAPNQRAHALYRRLGYRDEGRLRDALRFGGIFCDEIVMAKDLGPAGVPEWGPLLLDSLPPAPLAGLTVREAQTGDAAAYAAYDQAVRRETPFLMRTAAEGLTTATAARRFLAGQRLDPQRTTIVAPVGAAVGAELAGTVSVWFGGSRRTAHEASLGMAVRREYWASGVGKRLMAAAETWARGLGAHRLSLWVLGPNVRARRFYAACGFQEEAVCRRYALIDGRFADHVAMGKILG
ncbi:GNAT family N-acetyltransferase [Azospirillum sp. TSO22-1]|uniref:GNAT family N-acetyltransferase n=1 Tax=Azospirillum sp. TSO22-1 TaxID=716789 RepID=UPI000D647A22|nr:GNAT family N-acetyltransferase [Azospirillum sp. TSO22-1]